MIKYASGGKETFKGKRVAVSGSGNVAQYAALKAIELGATVVSLSDSKGCIVATGETGISPQQVEAIAQLKVERKALTEIASTESFKGDFKYIDGARPWTHVGKIDIALPSATQNEVSGDEAKALIEAGTKFIAEGSNMGCSQEAIEVFEEHRKSNKGEAIWYAPGKSTAHAPPLHTLTIVQILTVFLHQAKPPTQAGSPCPVWRWPRTRSAYPGPRKRSTPSSSRSWRTASTAGSRPQRHISNQRRASSPASLLAATSLASAKSPPP